MVWLAIALALCSVLQTVVLPPPLGQAVRPDLALVLVIGWATLRGWEEGLLAGLIGGFFVDLTSAAPLGIHIVRLGLVGLGAGLVMSQLARTSPLIPISVAGIASIGGFLLTVVGLQASGRLVPFERTLVLDAIPTAAVTAIGMAVLFPLLRACERRLYPPVEEIGR
jgi:rod shape-determining protein MreD